MCYIFRNQRLRVYFAWKYELLFIQKTSLQFEHAAIIPNNDEIMWLFLLAF